MSDYSDKVVLCRDNGLFFSLAQALAPHFKKVLYSTPSDEECPNIQDCIIGDGGFPNIERCDDPLAVVDDVDLFVFPHLGNVGMQQVIRRLGKRVWGSGAGCGLERSRSKLRELQANLGMDVPEFVTLKGIEALANHLRPLEDKWVKYPGKHRANWETWHWRSWREDWVKLYTHIIGQFGPMAEIVPFMVEDPIKTQLEIGGDFVCIDGQWPTHGVVGEEAKDKTYLAFLREWEDVPEEIREVLEPLGPELAACQYRNCISTEQRKTKRDNVLTDLTTRLGFPSGNCQLRLYANLADIIWHGSVGELVPVEPAAECAIECLVEGCGGGMNPCDWRSLKVPNEAAAWFNPYRPMRFNGLYWFPPLDVPDRCVGSIVGIGDSIEEAGAHVQEIAEMFKGQPVEICVDAIKDLIREAEAAKEQGIELTDEEIPEPSEVVPDE